MGAPPGALLCDIDGVVRLWPADGMPGVDRAHGLPEGTLAAAAFHPDRLLPAITGRIRDTRWREEVAAALAPRCGGLGPARTVVADWTAVRATVHRAMADLLHEVGRRIPVLLVSNATDRLEADLADLGLDGFGVVNSARVGAAKPDPLIYRAAAERAGAEPSACVFVDDTEANVVAARELGMQGVHVSGAHAPAVVRAALGLS